MRISNFFFLAQPSSLLITTQSSSTESSLLKFPDVTHLLEEEIIKPNILNEVIDFWEPPMTGQSGVPPPLTLPGMYTSVDYVSISIS